MHFPKSFAALVTVAFCASCAIAVPLDDLRSVPIPSPTLGTPSPCPTLTITTEIPSVPSGLSLPTPSIPFDIPDSCQTGLASIPDAPQLRGADYGNLITIIKEANDKMVPLADQFKPFASPDATENSVALPSQVSKAIEVLSDASNKIKAIAYGSPSAAGADANVHILANATLLIVSTALELAAGVLGAVTIIIVKSPLCVLAFPLETIVGFVDKLSGFLGPVLYLLL